MNTRVEPKTFFANERTLLSWLSISVLLMFTALALLGGGSSTGPVPAAGAPAGAQACTDSFQCRAPQVGREKEGLLSKGGNGLCE